MSGSVEAGIQQVLAAVGVTGFVHARCIDQDREVALRADEPVLMASVFKLAVCLELFRQAATGEADQRHPGRSGAGTHGGGRRLCRHRPGDHGRRWRQQPRGPAAP
jgi:hypothetical protein